MEFAPLLVAFTLGILGGAHCIGMCGGVIGALSMAVQKDKHWQRVLIIANYNLGRVLSYVFIAFLFYQFTAFAQSYFSFRIMRFIAALLLIAMGLYLGNWWHGLTRLEALGGFIWRSLQPLSRSLLPVQNGAQAFLLGCLWGWLPCGLIYSALVYSGTAASLPIALLTMLFFALGTMPAVLSAGLMAERFASLLKQKQLRTIFAITIIAYGLWILLGLFIHGH